MSQSTAVNPTVTRSGGTQALSPAATGSKSFALQPSVRQTTPGDQTVVPEPAR